LDACRDAKPISILVGHELVVLDGAQRHAAASQVVEQLPDRARLVALTGAASEAGRRVRPQLDSAAVARRLAGGDDGALKFGAAVLL
jgi:hypothetical protein